MKTNNMIAEKLREAQIPILAVDVDIPGAPIAGTNNYTAATMAGHAMAGLIREKWGGWDNVDLVVIMGIPGGEHLMLRAEGVADALAEEFGIEGVAFFPEHYAEYIVPAVAAMLTGNAVPPGIFVQNEVITKAEHRHVVSETVATGARTRV